MMGTMTTTDERRRRLADFVNRRRLELGLSINEAARLAGVSRGTWRGVERAERTTEEYQFAAIERALQWRPGSILDFLRGRINAPVPLGSQPEAEERAEDSSLPKDIQAAILAIQNVQGASESWKRLFIGALQELERERRAAQHGPGQERRAG